jgi:hypothetical protein
VTWGDILGNRLFESICSESVRLKTDGKCLQNVETLHSAGTTRHKAAVALRAVLTCRGKNGLPRLLPERKKAQ